MTKQSLRFANMHNERYLQALERGIHIQNQAEIAIGEIMKLVRQKQKELIKKYGLGLSR